MNFEVVMAMQQVCTGEKAELTKGQIAEQAIDLNIMLKNFSEEKKQRCMAYYNEMISNEEQNTYDIDTLMQEIEAQKKQFKNFIYNEDSGDQFVKMIDAIEELLINSPFEGLDSIAYGVAEVCIFSELEFFTCKKLGLDHDVHRNQYRNNLIHSTEGEAVADHWMGVYDDLQSRYESFNISLENDDDFKKAIITCSLISLAAIRDQDKDMLDMLQGRAPAKAQEILDSLNDETYDEGLSDTVDNAVAMFRFIYGYFIAE